MQLISLNTWGGKLYKPLKDFIKENSDSADIFCFQEVFNTTSNTKVAHKRRMNLFNELSKLLIDYQGYFSCSLQNYVVGNRTHPYKTEFDLEFGISIFIKKDIVIRTFGDFFVYGGKETFNSNDLSTIPRTAQYVTFTKSGKKFIICNLHGIWLKEGKKDAPSRIEQSKIINEFLKKQQGGKILCGDFNLDINTKSVKILEQNLKNLIKEYNIQTTRNKLFPGNEKFADYIFVSNGVKVIDFQVPKIEVSDHLPMILEFS